jgi:acyl carrier protein
MTAGLNRLERWSQEGIEALTPEQGVEAFAWILQHPNSAQIAVLPMRWADFGQSNRMRAFFNGVVEKHQQPTLATPIIKSSELLQQWAETAPNRRRRLLLDTIREEVIHVLGLRPTTVIDPRQPLNELGLDSLMAVELRNTLITLVGATLPATLLFDYPTSEALADYLMKNVPGLAPLEETDSVQEDKNDNLAELQQMSDAEAEALLLAELNKLNKGQ